MDLVSGSPIWLRGAPAAPAPARSTLARDLRCDIAILGAGVTGALLADRLAASGRRIVVLDRRYRAHGSVVVRTSPTVIATRATIKSHLVAGRCHWAINLPEGRMLLWLAIILVIAWAMGFVVFHVAGGLIHLLLVVALVVFVINLISGRRAV
jgi:hypothetical protein